MSEILNLQTGGSNWRVLADYYVKKNKEQKPLPEGSGWRELTSYNGAKYSPIAETFPGADIEGTTTQPDDTTQRNSC